MKDGNSGYCFRNHLSRVRDWFQNLESARTILSNSLLRVFPKYPLLCALSWILILATTGIFQPRHIFSVGGERNTWLWVELGRKFSCIHFQKRVKSVLRLADGLAKACPLETILLFNAGAHLGLFSWLPIYHKFEEWLSSLQPYSYKLLFSHPIHFQPTYWPHRIWQNWNTRGIHLRISMPLHMIFPVI